MSRLKNLKRRWEDNISLGLKETRLHTMYWIDSVKDKDYLSAIVNVTLILRVP